MNHVPMRPFQSVKCTIYGALDGRAVESRPGEQPVSPRPVSGSQETELELLSSGSTCAIATWDMMFNCLGSAEAT